MIVTAGQLKIRDGAPVKTVEAKPAAAAVAPVVSSPAVPVAPATTPTALPKAPSAP
jgi:hypothetical protein